MLPQSTVTLRVSRSYSKVTYLKRSKSSLLSFFFFFFLLYPTLHLNARSGTVKMTIDLEEIPQGFFFVLSLKQTTVYTLSVIQRF